MKNRWRVQLDGDDEHVEADEVEISASGALCFFRCASRIEKERTLLIAFASGQWRRCRLESNG